MSRRLDDAKKLLFADEWSGRKALATNYGISEFDQSLRNHPQWIKTRQCMHWYRSERCTTHRMDQPVCFRYCFGQHKENDDIERDADCHSWCCEQSACHDAGQCGLHGLKNIHGQQQRIDPFGWVCGKSQYDFGSFTILI